MNTTVTAVEEKTVVGFQIQLTVLQTVALMKFIGSSSVVNRQDRSRGGLSYEESASLSDVYKEMANAGVGALI